MFRFGPQSGPDIGNGLLADVSTTPNYARFTPVVSTGHRNTLS